MKLYKRPATPPLPFLVDSVDGWSLPLFAAWQKMVEESGRPAPTPAEYLREGMVDHYLAFTKDGTIIGTAQVCIDSEERFHIHRLLVHPEYRGHQVAAELVRCIDNDYEDEQLWAFVDDGADLKGLLELYLFEEAPDGRHPQTFRLVSDTRQDDLRPDTGPGDSGVARPAVAGAHPPLAGSGAGGGDGAHSQRDGGRPDAANKGARRGKRGGRRRKAKGR